MKTISDAIIELHYTNGETYSFPAGELREALQGLDRYTSIACTVDPCGEGREVKIRLSAVEAQPLRRVLVKLSFDKAFADEQLLVFNNGYISNSFVRIRPFAESEGAIWRGLTAMRHAKTGAVLGAGFMTNDKLLTYFKIVNRSLHLGFVLEDKPIPESGLQLETFVLDDTSPVEAFLEGYADELAARYQVKLDKAIPSGWCSWSCFYKEVNERDLMDAAQALEGEYARKGADLLQIDDGWQGTHTFAGLWEDNLVQFPSGIARLGQLLRAKGLRLGLWYAPFNAAEVSKLFQTRRDWFVHDAGGNPIAVTHSAGSKVYALDLAKPEVLDYLREVFAKATRDYGAVYFKLDFLNSGLIRGLENTLPFDSNDYAVAVLRKAMAVIRETVGEDAYMLGCGSPIHEAVGLFDAMRTTPDITWRNHQGYPTYWELLRDNTVTQLLRYFYHKRLFLNDADALVVRDYSADDGFDPSYEEAKLWATTVALSGGPVLINETIQKLGPARRKLFEELLPVFGEAARPLDYFERPYNSTAVLSMPKDKTIVVLYNWEDAYTTRSLELQKLGLAGDVLAVDCWEKKVAGSFREELPAPSMARHSAKAYLLCERPARPAFLFADNNFYCGADRLVGDFDERSGELSIRTINGEAFEPCAIFVYVPAHFAALDDERVWADDKGAVWRLEAGAGFRERCCQLTRTEDQIVAG